MKALFIFLFTFVFTYIYGGVEHFSSRISGSGISVNASFSVLDDKYLDMLDDPSGWPFRFTNHRITNRIVVGLNKQVLQQTDFSGSVDIEVKYDVWNATTQSFDQLTENRTLYVSNETNVYSQITDRSSFVFEGGNRMQVRVTGFSGLVVSQVYIEGHIEAERYYVNPGTGIERLMAHPFPSGSSFSSPDNQFIDLSWDYYPGAESYELEYVHINDYTLEEGVYKPFTTIAFDYYRNSTRVELLTNYYRIPNIYDHGYFIFRVRPVMRTGVDFKEKLTDWTGWSSQESGMIGVNQPLEQLIFIEREYHRGMNWSHQVAFTEEGKRFEGVSFADGLGRGRQSVSRNTATNQTVVSNVYFDELGRVVVSDLPTPLDQAYPVHHPNFNRSDVSGNPSFNYSNFDDPSTSDGSCTFDQYGMSNQFGASKYYSPLNANQEGSNGTIPDAENFPYSRMHYLNDFTGRMDMAAAAGPELTLGKGHETSFYYVTATQPELYQLFGEEVGKASHYQKLTTVDPNGQVYVQYTDMAGRVVASYMMGPAPTNLDELEDTASEILEIPISVNGSGQIPDNSTVSATLTYEQYFAEDNEAYNVSYSFTPQQYQSLCNTAPVCFDCVYELKLHIEEKCGEVLHTSSVTLNGEELDALCNAPTDYYTGFTLNIPRGAYTFTKTLRVNQQAINDYWCMYIDNITPECLSPLSDLFNDLYLQESFPECDEDDEGLDYDPTDDCNVKRYLMASDISPSGQYARYSVSAGVYSASDPTSIFYGATPPYTTFNYGSITVMDPVTNSLVSPAALSIKNYVLLFDASWSEYLIENQSNAHPESCMLGFCDANEASKAYDDGMLSVYPFTEAISYNATTQIGGYFLPLNFSTTPNSSYVAAYFGSNFVNCDTHLDPFFNTGGTGSAYAGAMENSMHDYIDLGPPGSPCKFSIWEYAILRAYLQMNPTITISGLSCNQIRAITRTKRDECVDDLVWVFYRDSYLELKQNYKYLAQAAYASANCPSMPEIGTGSGAYSGKWPHFPGIEFVNATLNDMTSSYGGGTIDFTDMTNSGAIQGVMGNVTQQGCETACQEYALEWLQLLSGCGISTADEPAILTAFENLCMSGCDAEHPMGASTPNPPTNPTIKQILASFGYTESMECTSLLISQPLPYEQTLTLIEQAAVPLDVCACDKILQAYHDLPGSGLSHAEQVLLAQTGIDLDDIDYLACECREAVDGTWEPGYNWPVNSNQVLEASMMKISPLMACPGSQGCVDCSEVTPLLGDLLDHFGFNSYSTVLENYEDFLLRPTAHLVLPNFLNGKLHFLKEYEDYANFIGGCLASETSPYCSVNPHFTELSSVLKLLSFRGQLTAASTIDLVQNNIVYANSMLYEEGILGRYFTGSVSGDELTMGFSTGSSSCEVVLTLPDNASFGFEDIVSFNQFVPLTNNCTDNSRFEVFVSYFSCGLLQTGILQGTTNCLNVNLCVCGDNGQLLCSDYEPVRVTECYQPILDELYTASLDLYQQQLLDMYTVFKQEYNAKCSEAFQTENFGYKGPFRMYQYTLFYYDQAGNLIKTVAPLGVNKLFDQDGPISDAQGDVSGPGDAGVPSIRPDHTYTTDYKYNSYNQLIETTNPDQEKETKFWYDRYGRIVASQNPVQRDEKLYSYSLYDEVGRPVEVGQVMQSNALTETILKADDLGATFVFWVNAGARSEITRTFYDEPMAPGIPALFANGVQQNLRLRVASVAYYDVDGGITTYVSATHYSYDIHGNVKEQIQDVPQLAPVQQDKKSTQYSYELISGNVTEVSYQKKEKDQLIHRYHYDELNRLTEAEVSIDEVHFDRQAHYHYYDYGPLARVEYGQNQVQGQDYAYTINGWIKGMNASYLATSKDMGRDATSGYLSSNTNVHRLFARDVTAYTLSYYDRDYRPINGSSFEIAHAGDFNNDARNLYNGNIRSLVSSISDMKTMGKAFHYDQLQRLTQMRAYIWDGNEAYDWSTSMATDDYFNSYRYDKNGNIRNLQRNGVGSTYLEMDKFEYVYGESLNGGYNNRLSWVIDQAGASMYDDADIDNSMSAGNYTYDALGQLLSDADENIGHIDWRYGDKKIRKITRTNNEAPMLEFVYNPLGQRVLKIEKPNNGNVSQNQWKYTYYAYDANGQVMAVYDVAMSESNRVARLSEQHLYGASRLGMLRQDIRIYSNGNEPIESPINVHIEGQTYYELTNYLGNVEAVITDRKTWESVETESFYQVALIQEADYYPFGMVMPERNKMDGKYRYGYNGMEMDNETKGIGNSYTTEFRQYDPRLGRWLSLDPLMHQFPWMSPYVAFDNNPIFYIDPYGLEGTNPEGLPENPCEGDVGTALGQEYEYQISDSGEGTWVRKHEAIEIVADRCLYLFAKEVQGVIDDVLSLSMSDLLSSDFPITTGITGVVSSPSYEQTMFYKFIQMYNDYKTCRSYYPPVVPITQPSKYQFLHNTLDWLGMIPIVGEAFDAVNALIYAAEGDFLNASISLSAIIPMFGSVGTGARQMKKIASGMVQEAEQKMVREIGQNMGEPTLMRGGGGAAKGVPLNRLNHIFGKSEHALESFVTKFGSQEKAYNAVQNAANQALKAGKLTPNAKGILPSGDMGNIINVGGMNVRLIGGRVENGQVILSSFSRKGL